MSGLPDDLKTDLKIAIAFAALGVLADFLAVSDKFGLPLSVAIVLAIFGITVLVAERMRRSRTRRSSADAPELPLPNEAGDASSSERKPADLVTADPGDGDGDVRLPTDSTPSRRYSMIVAIASIALSTALAAGVLVANTTSSNSGSPGSSKAQPSIPNDPSAETVRQTGCTYVASTEAMPHVATEPHQIDSDGSIAQEFEAKSDYIIAFKINVGYPEELDPGDILFELLDNSGGDHYPGAKLMSTKVKLVNNADTELRIDPIGVKRGERYWFRVVNTTNSTLGVYMVHVQDGPTHRKAAGLLRTVVSGEHNRPVGEKPDSLQGCVEGGD